MASRFRGPPERAAGRASLVLPGLTATVAELRADVDDADDDAAHADPEGA